MDTIHLTRELVYLCFREVNSFSLLRMFSNQSRAMELLLKRAYLPASPTDGYRVLVDRLWPRGLSKEDARLDEWNKDLAPSSGLRRWFGHDPARWATFSERYLVELRASDACQAFLSKVMQEERVTLIYAARDEAHCHPLVLKAYLEGLMASGVVRRVK